jgi:hypothetical protein
MKNRASWFVVGVLLITAVVIRPAIAQDAKITVMNPRGIQPPIRLVPLAPRPDTLDGKTVYIVDTNYPLTEQFVQEIPKILAAKYPYTKWIYKKKIGSYFTDDPKLWEEIKEKADGVIMAIGH